MKNNLIGALVAAQWAGIRMLTAILVISPASRAVAVEPKTVDEINRIRTTLLTESSFIRNTYQIQTPGTMKYPVGLLLGNAEMGGLARENGLGFAHSWYAGYWYDPRTRASLVGPELSSPELDANPETFRQSLNIENGVVVTTASYRSGASYEARMFCSHANRHLLHIQVKNISLAKDLVLNLKLANQKLRPASSPGRGQMLTGVTENGCGWIGYAVHVSKPLAADFSLSLKPGEVGVLRYAFAVDKPRQDIENRAMRSLEVEKTDAKLVEENTLAWAREWESSAVVVLPDPEYQKLFYRSIYWLLSTSGSEKYLPGEVQFSSGTWGMKPFSYGGAGWAVYAYIHLGLPDHARRMLEWHFQPEAFKTNAIPYLTGKTPNPEAWCFAHESDRDGYETSTWDQPIKWATQRHIQAFVAGFFHRYQQFYPDPEFKSRRLWPVLKGAAEFWRSIAVLDEATQTYSLPTLLSVSECYAGRSVLDAVLAAKYCLLLAQDYGKTHGLEPDLVRQWEKVNAGLQIPQDENVYLLSPDVPRNKIAGGSYFGYRAPMYLGFPVCELVPSLDAAKAARTLDETWLINNRGASMITFVASWFALTDLLYGRGDHALEVMGRNLQCWPEELLEVVFANKDPSKAQYVHPYYLDSYAAFSLIPLHMMVQSSPGQIKLFPAVPGKWKNVAFYQIPAEDGIRVSGEMIDGKIAYVDFQKDGRSLLRLNEKRTVRILRKSDSLKLEVLDRE